MCTLGEFLQRAPSDDWTSLGLSLYSFIMLTGCVSVDPEEKNHTFSWVLVLCLSYSRHVRVAQKEHFHIHKVAAELVTGDLVANEVPLEEC